MTSADFPRRIQKRLRLLSARIGLPFAFHGPVEIAGLRESLRSPEQYDYAHDFQVLAPYQPLQVDDPEQQAYLRKNPEFAEIGLFQRACYVCRVPGAKVNLRTGAVATPDNRLLIDSVGDTQQLAKLDLMGRMAPNPPRMTGAYASIMGPYAANYYHWLVDYLPRLYGLQATLPTLNLIMPDSLTPFQRETLTLCLPANITLITSLYEWVQVEDYWFTPVVGHIPSYAPAYMEYVRDCILAKMGHPAARSTGERLERIYITRSGSKFRRVLNEAEVLDCLKRYAFKPYALEDMPFAEQVALFSRAEAVIAPHGAGLTNMLFANHIKLLEFVNALPNYTYFFLAHLLGHEYHYWANPHVRRNMDFNVNLDDLTRLMASLF